MTIRRAIPVLAVLVALALGWIVLRDRHESSVPAPIATVPVEGAKSQVEELAAAKTPTERSESSARNASIPDPADFVTVEIRDRETLALVPNADVWSVALDAAAELAQGLIADTSSDVVAFVRERGERSTSDAGGRVLLDRGAGERLVVAVSAERDGFAYVSAMREHGRRVLIGSSDDLRVRVRDADGAPVAIGLSIRTGGGYDAPLTARTDTRGELLLRNVRDRLEFLRAEAGPFAIRLDVVALDPLQHWIDPRDWPTGTIELVLPPCGAIRLHAVDGEGREMPIDAAASAWIELRQSTVGRRAAWGFDAPCERGVARFDHVELGAIVRTTLEACGTKFSQDSAGPTRPGQCVEVRMDVSESYDGLRARLVDEHGVPLARRRWIVAKCVLASAGAPFEAGKPMKVTSDDDGRVALEVAWHRQDDPAAGRAVVWVREDVPIAPVRVVEIPVPPDLNGLRDLGDVRVPIVEPLVVGRVVDRTGMAVPFHEVELVVHRNEDGEMWVASDFGARTSSTGEFALYAPCPGSDAGVAVADWEESAVERGFKCGSTSPVELVVRGAGMLEGTLLHDEGALRGLDVSFEYVDGGQTKVYASSAGLADLGPKLEGSRRAALVVHYLPAGTGTLVLREPTSSSVLARIEGIRVRSGRTTSDPRLVDVDLRGKLTPPSDDDRPVPVDLVIVDEHGLRVSSGAIESSWSSHAFAVLRFVDGHALGEVDRGAALAVTARGKLREFVEPPFTGRTIVLRDAPKLVIAVDLPPDLRPPKANWVLWASFETSPSSPPYADASSRKELALDEGGETSIVFEQRVDAVRLSVSVQARRDERWFDVGPCEPRSVQIVMDSGPQRVEARLSSAQLEAARAWIRSIEKR